MNAVKEASNPYRVNNVPLRFVSLQDAGEEKLKVSLFRNVLFWGVEAQFREDGDKLFMFIRT